MFWSHFLNPDKSSAEAGYHRVSQKEARQMMEKPGVIVVDVREPEEYAQGHIPGARLLTLDRIGAKSAADVIPEKETQTLVYCRSGHRSKRWRQGCWRSLDTRRFMRWAVSSAGRTKWSTTNEDHYISGQKDEC